MMGSVSGGSLPRDPETRVSDLGLKWAPAAGGEARTAVERSPRSTGELPVRRSTRNARASLPTRRTTLPRLQVVDAELAALPVELDRHVVLRARDAQNKEETRRLRGGRPLRDALRDTRRGGGS